VASGLLTRGQVDAHPGGGGGARRQTDPGVHKGPSLVARHENEIGGCLLGRPHADGGEPGASADATQPRPPLSDTYDK